MRQTKLIGFFSTLVLLLAFSVTIDGQKKTVIKVSTTTETTTFTKRTSTVCLSLISEGGVGPTPCRRRRQFWIEEPILLEPYNQFDEYYSQFLIQPTNVFQLETTAAPLMDFRNDPFSGMMDDEYDSPAEFFLPHLPQSSLWMPSTDFRPRIYFKNGDTFARGGYRRAGNRKTSKKTTITFTRTRLVTETEMSTNTNTIGISGCTPSPLFYDICP